MINLILAIVGLIAVGVFTFINRKFLFGPCCMKRMKMSDEEIKERYKEKIILFHIAVIIAVGGAIGFMWLPKEVGK